MSTLDDKKLFHKKLERTKFQMKNNIPLLNKIALHENIKYLHNIALTTRFKHLTEFEVTLDTLH